MKKRVFALFMALVMLFGLVACGAKQEPAPAEPEKAPAAEKSEETKEPVAEAPADAVQEPVTLKFYCWANEQADQQAVFDELNKYFQEKYNTTVDFQFAAASFNDKMSMVINSGEEFDACFTSNWMNDYATNVAKEAFIDISGMLKDYPALYNAMPEAYWQAATIDGGIYAVPNVQIAARNPGVIFKSEQFNAYGLDDATVNGWSSLMDAKDYLQYCYDQDGSMFAGVADDALAQYCGYELLGALGSCAAVKLDDPECKVVNFFETPEFRQICEDTKALYELGLVDSQCIVDTDYLNAQRRAGRLSLLLSGTWAPGSGKTASVTYGVPTYVVGGRTPVLTTGGIIATMWGISSTSKYPDRTMQILELFLTDPYVMNLISHGIEGTHYDLEDGFVVTKPDGGYAPGVSWAFGNVFLTHPVVGNTADVWEQTRTLNETADVSRLIGFSYSGANVGVEASNTSSVVAEYAIVRTGAVDVDATMDEFLAKLKTAGVDTIIADAQAQVDAFFGK